MKEENFFSLNKKEKDVTGNITASTDGTFNSKSFSSNSLRGLPELRYMYINRQQVVSYWLDKICFFAGGRGRRTNIQSPTTRQVLFPIGLRIRIDIMRLRIRIQHVLFIWTRIQTLVRF
jgi:hypothetical protein